MFLFFFSHHFVMGCVTLVFNTTSIKNLSKMSFVHSFPLFDLMLRVTRLVIIVVTHISQYEKLVTNCVPSFKLQTYEI